MYLLIPMCQTNAEKFPFTLVQNFSGLALGTCWGLGGQDACFCCLYSLFLNLKNIFLFHIAS